MLRTTTFVAAIALGLGALPAYAETDDDFILDDASDLADLCSSPQDPAAIHMCHGFLLGAHRVYQVVGAGLGTPFYCIPTDGSVTRDTAAANLAAWISATPEAATMKPHEALMKWAETTYPCN